MKIYKAEYTNIGSREKNEDVVLCIVEEEKIYGIIADGLGGQGDGSIASAIAVQQLSKCSQCQQLPNKTQIETWFQEANQEILKKNKSASGMKTTVVFLAVNQGNAVWAHIGDSRLYHFYSGKLLHYTDDHSLPQVQVNMGELTREEIPLSPERNQVLRSLGEEGIEVEIHPAIELFSGRNAFLLCTDGFWEYLSDLEIQLDLYKSESPKQWLDYLRCRGEKRRNINADNNTAAAIFIDV